MEFDPRGVAEQRERVHLLTVASARRWYRTRNTLQNENAIKRSVRRTY